MGSDPASVNESAADASHEPANSVAPAPESPAPGSHTESFVEVEYSYDDAASASDNASEPVVINRTESMNPLGPGEPEIAPADTVDNQPAAGASPARVISGEDDPTEEDELAFGLELKKVEETVTQVARDVQEVARGVSSRLTTDLTKIAGGLSQWWANLDPPPQAKLFSLDQLLHDSVKPSGELQVLFGLDEDESLIEEFRSKLQQTYACNHNNFTPSVQMAFKGTAYITNRHLCFSVEERSRKIPIKVPLAEVVKANATNPRGSRSDALRLELRSGDWMVLRDFEPQDAADSALALVEHLMGDAS